MLTSLLRYRREDDGGAEDEPRQSDEFGQVVTIVPHGLPSKAFQGDGNTSVDRTSLERRGTRKLFKAAASQQPPVVRAVLFVGLLVKRPQGVHHIIEQVPVACRLGGAQVRRCFRAHASDAHDARTARFSLSVRSGSLTTWDGCSKACAGCSRSFGSHPSSRTL